jgi:hypothetical protein
MGLRIQPLMLELRWCPAFDGGVPGACDEQTFDKNGAPFEERTNTFDAQGHQLTEKLVDSTNGSPISDTQSIFDACGHELWHHTTFGSDSSLIIRNDYRKDGLLARTATLQTGSCSVVSRGYLKDAVGRVIAIYDPVACEVKQRLTYGDDGRVATVTTLFGGSNGSSTDTYSCYPDGAMKEHDLLFSVNSTFDKRTYDEHGLLIAHDTNRGLPPTGDEESDSFVYRPDGQLQSDEKHLQAIGCGDSDSTITNTFSSSLLIHSDLSGFSGCRAQPATASIDYTYGQGTRTADTKDANGNLTLREQSDIDARGNQTFVQDATPPQLTFIPVVRRSFSGCGLP